MNKEISIILGPPLSGKSTFAIKQKKYEHISMGCLCKKEINSKSVSGDYINESLKYGLIIPSYILIPIIKNYLESTNYSSYLIDGFPKSEEESNCLLYMATVFTYKLNFLFILKTPKDQLLNRLNERKVCEKWYKPINSKYCVCGGKSTVRIEDTKEYFEKRYDRYVKNSYQIIKNLQPHFQKIIYV